MEDFEVRVKIGNRNVDCFKIKAECEQNAIKICKERYEAIYYILAPIVKKS